MTEKNRKSVSINLESDFSKWEEHSSHFFSFILKISRNDISNEIYQNKYLVIFFTHYCNSTKQSCFSFQLLCVHSYIWAFGTTIWVTCILFIRSWFIDTVIIYYLHTYHWEKNRLTKLHRNYFIILKYNRLHKATQQT